MTKQSGWASCPRCQGLHFAGFPDFKGECPAGGPHQQGNSFVYEVDFDVAAGPKTQLGWASCPKCQGLHFAGFPDFKGVCPSGGPHQQNGSFAYALQFDIAPPDGTQAEWRSCAKCQVLFYGPFGGMCPADNGRHSDANSFNYVLTVSSHPFIALRALRDENGPFIEVTGRGFTSNSSVQIDYIFKASNGTGTNATMNVSSLAGGDLGRVRIPVTLGDLHYGGVKATDTASGRSTAAEIEAP